MNFRFSLCALFCLGFGWQCHSQYRWDVKDPLDFNVIDFGDNKLLLYNGIGTGLTLLLDKGKDLHQELPSNSVSLQYFQEYRKSPFGYLGKMSFRHRYAIRDHLYIGGEYSIIYADDGESAAMGLGGILFFEWHLIKREAFRLIYDNGVGPNSFLNPFPIGGTRFSFTTYYGFKAELKLNRKWYSLSLTNIHISNADIKGRERNPSLDGVGVSIGLLF